MLLGHWIQFPTAIFSTKSKVHIGRKEIFHRLLCLWKCCTLQFIVLIKELQPVVSSCPDAVRNQIKRYFRIEFKINYFTLFH